MADRLVSRPTILTRAELGVIFKNNLKAIKAFEDLQDATGIRYVEIINGILDSIDAANAAPPPADHGLAESLQQVAFAIEAVSSQLAGVREEMSALRSDIEDLQKGPL